MFNVNNGKKGYFPWDVKEKLCSGNFYEAYNK